MSLHLVQRRGAVADVLARLQAQIAEGRYPPDARLPSESELCKAFGVSRPVVREALAQLRERDLVETVSGSGTSVKHPDADHLTHAVVRHLRVAAGETETIAKVYEARLALESTTARLAAERRSEGELEQIAALLEVMRTAPRELERWTAADLGFHVAVARASHNPFLSTLLAPE